MSHFANTDLRTIDLGNEEWVKIPVELSFDDVAKIKEGAETEIEASKKLLTCCLKEWNLKDKAGNPVELNIENIMKLNIDTVTVLINECSKLIVNDQDKKK